MVVGSPRHRTNAEKFHEGNWPVPRERCPQSHSRFFLEINNLEIGHELVCAATCFGAQAVVMCDWEDDFREAWTKQVCGKLLR